MKTINKDVLKDAANRLLFDMKDSEYDTLLSEFDSIQHQLSLMEKNEGVNETTPMTFTFDVSIDT